MIQVSRIRSCLLLNLLGWMKKFGDCVNIFTPGYRRWELFYHDVEAYIMWWRSTPSVQVFSRKCLSVKCGHQQLSKRKMAFEEQNANMKFNQLFGKSSIETLHMSQQVFGERTQYRALSIQEQPWIRTSRFVDWSTMNTSYDEEKTEDGIQILRADGRQTINGIAEKAGILFREVNL